MKVHDYYMHFDGLWGCLVTGRLEAMLLEAKGLWAEAEKAYASLLEENPCDQVIILVFLYETILIYFSFFIFKHAILI